PADPIVPADAKRLQTAQLERAVPSEDASKHGASSLRLDRLEVSGSNLYGTNLYGSNYRPLDVGEFAALRAGVPAASFVLDLPRRGAVIANVSAFELVAPDFRTEVAAIVDGRKVASPLEAPLPLAYAGSIAGQPDSRVYLGFGHGEGASIVVGVVEIGEDSWWISDGGLRAAKLGLPAMIAHESALAGQPLDGLACIADELAENAKFGGSHGHDDGNSEDNSDDNSDGGIAGGPGCREFRIAVDTDTEFTMVARGGSTASAMQYALLLMGAASQVYARDIDARLPINYLRLWTGEDPWTMGGMVDQLYQYRDYWVANEGGISRDLGHHLAGRGLGGGVAWLGVVCAYPDYAFGLSSGIGYGFPYPLIDHDHGNWEPMVVNHEIGHNFGAPHTHDHNPQADGCGTNDCSQAWTGTIMSYCHGCPGGMSNVSLLFHQYSKEPMNGFIAGVPCANGGAFAVADAASVLENGSVAIDVLTNDAFVNCAQATVATFAAQTTVGGQIARSASNPSILVYTAPLNFVGIDGFTYSILDTDGNTSTATVSVTVREVRDRTYVLGNTAGVGASWFVIPEGTSALPDFGSMQRYGSATLANIDIPSTGGEFSTSGRADFVGARFDGWLNIPETGLWSIATESDDGSRISIDGVVVVDNDGLHGMVDRSGLIGLEKGLHRIMVDFFENGGGAGEIVRWEGPGTSRAVIPASAYSRGGFIMQIDLDGDGTIGAGDLSNLLASWGPAPAGTLADFDRNGSVGAADLSRLLEAWGT
ncbi:MAG: M12 family metallo-peptidase, partial [bacterium]